ncbi:MAG: fibronectin type III domain-containing protein [Acidimicrobiales bacterium]
MAYGDGARAERRGPEQATAARRCIDRFHKISRTSLGALCLVSAVLGATALVGPATPAAASTPTTVTQTFGFDSDTLQNFTVPADVTSLTITATGGQGGWGGADASGNPPAGGYQGQVSGTIAVTPGDYLTIGVGSGADEPFTTACTGGADEQSPVDAHDAVGGANPLTQYDGGPGGAPGYNGCSGYGGAGGAASVVEVGSSQSAPTSVGTIVAGGGGGDGGSGQYSLVRGQIGLASYVAQTAPTPVTYGIPAGCTSSCTSQNTIQSPSPLPTDPTQGQAGIAVFTMCGGDTTGNNADQFFNTGAPNSEAGCDGGGGAGGGGGAAGGAAGNDEFGSGSSDEWYGQGASPGENSTTGFAGLSAIYAYYADTNTGRPTSSNAFADPGSQFDGSVVITYATGVPAAPTAVTGTPGNSSVTVQWSAPSAGSSPITDYVVQYSSDGGADWSTDDTASTSTSATVSGLQNGTGYIFEVEAVNAVGDGPLSSPTGTLTPSGPPGTPTITSIVPGDGSLQVGFTAPTSSTPITGYLYQLDGSGPWYASAATSSPLTVSGLTDGTTYSVEIEGTNSSGTGEPSNSMSQTPVALPGAPTITSVDVGPGSASIAFTPGSTGGSTLTGYRYSTNGGTSWTTASATSPLAVSGLANATTFSFELEADNVSGYGAPASASFTTPSAPSAPVLSSVVAQNQALQVNFAPPSSGGSPITDYEWSTDGGTTWYSESSAGTPCQSSGGSSETCEIAASSADGSTALTNGTAYGVAVRAVNAVGVGSGSNVVSGTPCTTPDAPTITTGSAGMVPADQTLTVSFSAPASDGGSAVTGYAYSTDAGATWHARTDGAAATSLTMTISALSSDGATALTNGTTYDVEIRALNAAGSGPGSAVAAGIPVTVPGAPTVTTVTADNGALGVTFTPGPNGGSTITSYQYSTDGTTWTTTGSLSSAFIITGLTNGTSYPVSVRALNIDGASPPSASVSGTPATVPGQPAITGTTRGNATISVSYSEPSTGGSPVVTYQYSTDAGVTWFGAGSTADPLVITALSTNGSTPVANGTQYPVEIRAVNAIGVSLASSPIEVAPATAPAAPGVNLVAGDGAITVQATITDNGGSPVTGIDYSLDAGPFVSTGTTSSTFTIPGLVNGTSYSVSVRADNAIGPGTASTPADAVPATTPGSPTAIVATSDSASADVSWTAPESDGGSTVTGYTATAYTSASGTTTVGTPCTTATLGCTVTGLTNGTTYYIGVVATNAMGSSISSNPLQAVTPIARPGAPTLTGVSSGDSYLSLSFTAGGAGGDPISSYQYSLDGGTTWLDASGTTSPLIIDGLVDGTSYTITVRAVSAAGPGTKSNSETGTPYTYPDPVDATTVTANGESGQAVVSWTVPGNGGSAITEAQATAFSSLTGGTQDGTCTSTTNLTVGDTTSCTITGLSNNTTYYISIQSENAGGWSGRSTPRLAVTPSVDPGPVSRVTGNPGDGSVVVSWTPGSTGASAISNYVVWYSSGGSYTQFNRATSTATTATVTGLTNGTAYTFEVAAVNGSGTGPLSAPSSPVTPEGPSITSAALPGGEVGAAYDVTPAVSGGTGPFTWSVSNGSLPSGLSLDTATGAVTGTPTTSGTSTFDLVVDDSLGGSATQAESVDVVASPSVISPTLVAGEVGAAYDVTPAVSGGTGPFTWSVSNGSLPAGLSIDASTGAITGTPITSATSSFDLVAEDTFGDVATQSESLAVVADPQIGSAALGDGELDVAYEATPSVSGGTGPFTWSVSSGSLPGGLSIDASTGAITGTPTTGGSASFTVMVTDAEAQTATRSETVFIADLPVITSAALPGGEVGVAYDATPTVLDGTGPYTWSVTNGSLPPGLSIDAGTGEVTGVPATGGPAQFTLVVTDTVHDTATQPESLVIAAVPTPVGTGPIAADVGAPVGEQLTVDGGTGPYDFTVSGGSLPAGVGLSPGGMLSGVPDDAGQFQVTVTITDARGQQSHETLDVTVRPSSLNSRRMAVTPDGDGYWVAWPDGDVSAFGAAHLYGTLTGRPLVAPIVGMAATPDGDGYWLVAADGGVFAFGDAAFHGSEGGHRLDAPVVGMAATPDGSGYWLVAADGGVFAFGDAAFHGSEGGHRLDAPVVGMAATPGGSGYWLVASDGGVFCFGDAGFYGSESGRRLNAPIDGIEATQNGEGYWLVGADNGVFAFGDAPFMGADPQA